MRGGDFVWERIDEDVDWVLMVLKGKYELKSRDRPGFRPKDVRKIDMVDVIMELSQEGITWHGVLRHFDMLKEYFGVDDNTKRLSKNVY